MLVVRAVASSWQLLRARLACWRASATTVTSRRATSVKGAFVTGSEVERWGLGVVQEIDSAAMHLWARWQHQELERRLTGVIAIRLAPRRAYISATMSVTVTRTTDQPGASTIGICSRSVASSSSKPQSRNSNPTEAAPFGAASFLPGARTRSGEAVRRATRRTCRSGSARSRRLRRLDSGLRRNDG